MKIQLTINNLLSLHMKITLRVICDHILRCVEEHKQKYGTQSKHLLMKRLYEDLKVMDSEFMNNQTALIAMMTDLEKPVNLSMLNTVISMYEANQSGEKSLEEAGKVVNQHLNETYVEPHLTTKEPNI